VEHEFGHCFRGLLHFISGRSLVPSENFVPRYKENGCAALKWLNPLKRLSGQPRISRMTRICRTKAKEENRLLACTRFSYPAIVARDEI
jgi:hypothetical protein